MPHVIVTTGLTKRFGLVTAVDGLTISVEQGEIYALLGLNGAGKSTVIRMLLGMTRPSGGVARVLGADARRAGPRTWERVGYLIESATAYPELTVRENVEVAARLRNVGNGRAVDRVMERVRLGPYAHRRAGTLSAGNAQRLGLAKAMVHDPDLLILDEPASYLDPAGVVEIRGLLRSLASERGVTALVSSHALPEVQRLGARVGIIHEGRLVEELPSETPRRLVVDARDRDAARSVLSGAGFAVAAGPGGLLLVDDRRALERPDDVASLLVAAGAPPTLLRVEEEDLESRFLRAVGSVR
ncbi:MAG: ABC transporter ATP-binding protein [Actinomycetota bacterium]